MRLLRSLTDCLVSVNQSSDEDGVDTGNPWEPVGTQSDDEPDGGFKPLQEEKSIGWSAAYPPYPLYPPVIHAHLYLRPDQNGLFSGEQLWRLRR